MSEPQSELIEIADQLRELLKQADKEGAENILNQIIEKAQEVGKAWSGSYLGYHAYVYFSTLTAPPPGARFSPEWGLMETYAVRGTTGDWMEFGEKEIRDEIERRSGKQDLSEITNNSLAIKRKFEHFKSETLSILYNLSTQEDNFLASIKASVDKIEIWDKSDFVSSIRTPSTMTRDSTAATQGTRLPHHLSLAYEIQELRDPFRACEELEKNARRAGSHLLRKVRSATKKEIVGTNVFIGHGRSLIWRELKDFIQERLSLPSDEFNRVPVAGVTNIARLSEMLDAAAIALLVMTAEDEQADGAYHARMNVIHEAGLFQGRLGFSKAIVLLEQGCEEFSNIQGLGQIRFPKGNIRASFEEIRLVLEREGLITLEQ